MGQITAFGFNFAPRNWAQCNGQMQSIAQNNALFALLGTTYGGDGRTTFGLPDLRGRTPLHQGQGPGLPLYNMGQMAGNNQVTLTQVNMPIHAHALASSIPCNNGPATTNNPVGAFPAVVSATSTDPNGIDVTTTPLAYATSSNANMGAGSGGNTQPAGGSQPFDITNPYVVVNWCIATQGIFPSRN
jgi:microcystin-dependent protein